MSDHSTLSENRNNVFSRHKLCGTRLHRH
jgi:hypothetical protein